MFSSRVEADVEETVRSRSQDKGKLECMCRLRGCSNPFDSQANIVNHTAV